jgi:hypothetical protein
MTGGLSETTGSREWIPFFGDFRVSQLSRWVLIFSLFLTLALGCSKKDQEVSGAILSGKISYKAKPVPGGKVTFHGKGKDTMVGAQIQADGSYVVVGLPAGEVVVTVETESINPDTELLKEGKDRKEKKGITDSAFIKSKIGVKTTQAPPAATYVKIPAKYADPKTSDLTLTVGQGKQTQDFTLKD